jgi:hypothetical protein
MGFLIVFFFKEIGRKKDGAAQAIEKVARRWRQKETEEFE